MKGSDLKLYSSSTVIASVGHEVTQAIQRMQSSGLTGTDFVESGYSVRSWISKTSTGQRSAHTSSPLHLVQSTLTFGIFTQLIVVNRVYKYDVCHSISLGSSLIDDFYSR